MPNKQSSNFTLHISFCNYIVPLVFEITDLNLKNHNSGKSTTVKTPHHLIVILLFWFVHLPQFTMLLYQVFSLKHARILNFKAKV